MLVNRSVNLVWKTKHFRCEVLIFLENKHKRKQKQTNTYTQTKKPNQTKIHQQKQTKQRFKIIKQNKNSQKTTPQNNNNKKTVADRQNRVSFCTQRTSWFTFGDAEEMLAWWKQCLHGARRDHSIRLCQSHDLKCFSCARASSLLLLYWDATVKEQSHFSKYFSCF